LRLAFAPGAARLVTLVAIIALRDLPQHRAQALSGDPLSEGEEQAPPRLPQRVLDAVPNCLAEFSERTPGRAEADQDPAAALGQGAGDFPVAAAKRGNAAGFLELRAHGRGRFGGGIAGLVQKGEAEPPSPGGRRLVLNLQAHGGERYKWVLLMSVVRMNAVVDTHLSGARLSRRGKVRELYDLGDSLLLVASDRISAFDCVLTPGIPDKGKILTQLSNFWFRKFPDV